MKKPADKKSRALFLGYHLDNKKVQELRIQLSKREIISLQKYRFRFSHKISVIYSKVLIQQCQHRAIVNSVDVAGHIWKIVKHSSYNLIYLLDETGEIGLYFSKDNLDETALIELDLMKVGDIIGVIGFTCYYKNSEISICVNKYEILLKAVS